MPGNPADSRRSIVVVQDRADAAVPGEQRVAAEPEQVQIERLVRLPLVVALDLNRDRLRGLAGREGECAARGRVVTARRRGAVDGAVRDRDGLVGCGREADRKRERGAGLVLAL